MIFNHIQQTRTNLEQGRKKPSIFHLKLMLACSIFLGFQNNVYAVSSSFTGFLSFVTIGKGEFSYPAHELFNDTEEVRALAGLPVECRGTCINRKLEKKYNLRQANKSMLAISTSVVMNDFTRRTILDNLQTNFPNKTVAKHILNSIETIDLEFIVDFHIANGALKISEVVIEKVKTHQPTSDFLLAAIKKGIGSLFIGEYPITTAINKAILNHLPTEEIRMIENLVINGAIPGLLGRASSLIARSAILPATIAGGIVNNRISSLKLRYDARKSSFIFSR